jgi:cholesterol oxidase
VSRTLGGQWSANANVLSMALYADARRVEQTTGPTISSLVDFMDGAIDGQRFVIEDDGFPNVLLNSLQACVSGGARTDFGRAFLRHVEDHVRREGLIRHLMVWLGAGTDAADGVLSLKRSAGRKRTALSLRWDAERSRPVVETILTLHRKMTEATAGRLLPNPGWSLFRNLVTLHPLGGCRIGVTPGDGVVNHLGEVFGHPNLFVVDGAILPASVGRNPSHTIAALAERIAEHVR